MKDFEFTEEQKELVRKKLCHDDIHDIIDCLEVICADVIQSRADASVPTPSDPAQPSKEDEGEQISIFSESYINDQYTIAAQELIRIVPDIQDVDDLNAYPIMAKLLWFKEELTKISIYAASVCADKDREIAELKDEVKSAQAEVERLKWEKELMLRSNTRWTEKAKQLESELAESKRRVAELEDTWTGKENGLPKPK